MQVAPHPQRFSAHPLTYIAVAFTIGIIAARLIRFTGPIPLVIAAVLTLLTILALLKNRLNSATTLLLLAALAAGALLAEIEKSRVSENQLKRLIDEGVIEQGAPVELTGVVNGPPESAPDSVYLSVRVERIRFKKLDCNVSGVVALVLTLSQKESEAEYEQLELRYGARVRVMTVLNRADNFRNPGVSTFTEYLDQQGYDATGFIKSTLLFERLDDDRVFLPLFLLYDWRRRIELELYAKFSASTASVLDAALLGNRHNLPQSTAERFREGGTFHVLVISGLHISFIGGLMFFLARRITRRKMVQVLVSNAALWCYTFAVGAQASVVRAALMFTLVICAPMVFRRNGSLNGLGAAALLLLVRHPADLFNPAFQLTFMSVLAIAILAWPLLQRMQEIGSWRPTRATPYPPDCRFWLRTLCEALFWSQRRWTDELRVTNYSYRLFKHAMALTLERFHLQRFVRHSFAAVVISISVQVILLPFLIIYFHRLSLAATVLNIGVGLMMALLAIVAVAALLLAQASVSLATPLISLANGLNWLMVHSVDPLAKAGLDSFRLPEYSGWPAAVYGLYYLPFVFLVGLLRHWSAFTFPKAQSQRFWLLCAPYLGLTQAFALSVLVFHPLSAGRPDGRLHIEFLDVGQGDSALLTMPDGRTLLIDGGGRPNFFRQSGPDEEDDFQQDRRSIGEAVVSEYLWWRGFDRIDYILPTHADADHIDGLNDVARNFKVRAALIARTPAADPEYAKFAETLRMQNIPLRIVGAGDVLRFGNVRAEVLSPPPFSESSAPYGNNDSIVLRMHFGERTVLLTGDIESGAENAMLAKAEDVTADVIKVAHHGSKTSSTETFVRAVHARFAIISVGLTSPFGHPNREVVDRWKTSGAEVLTTGNYGTIGVSSDGKDLQLTTFVHE